MSATEQECEYYDEWLDSLDFSCSDIDTLSYELEQESGSHFIQTEDKLDNPDLYSLQVKQVVAV